MKTHQELTGTNYNHTNTYAYDEDGNRKSISYPSGYTFQYNYTGRNQLGHIDLPGYGTVASYVYDRAGNRQQRSMHNQTVTDYAPVDVLNRSAWVRHTFGGGQAARFDYDFDEMNRLKYEQRDSGTADGYTYDQTGQAVGMIWNGTFSNGTVSGSVLPISYDAAGNRTGAWGNAYSVNNLNEYTSLSGAPIVSDSKGNLQTYNGWTYTYDAQNRLRSAVNGATTVQFWYDPLNRQIARSINGTVTRSVWDGWNLIEERDANDASVEYYLHGARADELVVRFGGAYGTTWFCQDGRGNTSHMVGDANEVLEHYKYGWFGGPQIFDAAGNGRSQSAWDNRFFFQGRDFLKEIGLYDYRSRFYNSTLGRFMQSDPIGFHGDPSNLYRYCGNDPVNRRDPFGLLDDSEGPDGKPPVPMLSLNGIIVYGRGVETAETAGPYPDANASPLDYSGAAPGEGSVRDTGGRAETGGAIEKPPATSTSPAPPTPTPPVPQTPTPSPKPYNWSEAKNNGTNLMIYGGIGAGIGGLMTFVPGLQLPGFFIGTGGAFVGFTGLGLYIGARTEELRQDGG